MQQNPKRLLSILSKMRLSIKRFRNSANATQHDHRYFLIGSIDPRLPATILSILQILFSIACLITASVYIDGLLRTSSNVETCLVLGFGVVIFVIQIILSACTLYAIYVNNATMILCQAIWQVVLALFSGILCAVMVDKFVSNPLMIGYILMGVTLVSTPVCVVDACMILIYFRSYQLIKHKNRQHRCDQSIEAETKFASSPDTTVTLSTLDGNAQPVDYQDDFIPVQTRKIPNALLPPVPVLPMTDPVKRHPSSNRNGHMYSVYGRRAAQNRSVVAASYSSMRWTQGEHFAELIHRTPTGEVVLNLREEGMDDWNTEA